MDHFKSDFLKVFMLFIIFISFTSGGNQALEDCKLGMRMVFGSERKSLRSCVFTAILEHRIKIWPHREEPYLEDVNEYYRSMHTLMSAEGIELPGDFCERLDEPRLMNSFYLRNPNETDCKTALESFENDIPESNIYKADPTDTEEIRVYKLKKRILYNALYNHVFGGDDMNSPYIHPTGSYAYVYLYINEPNLGLINDNNHTPEKFCKNIHNNGEEDDDDDDDEDDEDDEDDGKNKDHKYEEYYNRPKYFSHDLFNLRLLD